MLLMFYSQQLSRCWKAAHHWHMYEQRCCTCWWFLWCQKKARELKHCTLHVGMLTQRWGMTACFHQSWLTIDPVEHQTSKTKRLFKPLKTCHGRPCRTLHLCKVDPTGSHNVGLECRLSLLGTSPVPAHWLRVISLSTTITKSGSASSDHQYEISMANCTWVYHRRPTQCEF